MKTFICLILFLANYPLLAQITSKERIPNGSKGAGSVIYTEVSRDTACIAVVLPGGTDGEYDEVKCFTIEDVIVENDIVEFEGGFLWYMYQGKWENSQYQKALAEYQRVEEINAKLRGDRTTSDIQLQALRALDPSAGGGMRYAGEYKLPEMPVKEPLPNTSNIIKNWTIQIVKRKYPDYYNKWLKK